MNQLQILEYKLNIKNKDINLNNWEQKEHFNE